jgi:hypothetical protein
MTVESFFPSSFVRFMTDVWGGSGSARANQTSLLEQSGKNTIGRQQTNISGFNPGGDPTLWQGRNRSQAGNVGLQSDFSTGILKGTAQTQAQQAIMDTPKAKAASHWVVNDLKPAEDGKAMAQVTQVLDVANADGSTSRIGKSREVLFDGKPVVQGPSSTQWTSTSYRLKYNNQTGVSMNYNQADSDGNDTTYASNVYREGDTWVQDTQGNRRSKTGVSTLDGLGAYSPTQPGKNLDDPGLSQWLNQQFQQGHSWLNTGNLVATS